MNLRLHFSSSLERGAAAPALSPEPLTVHDDLDVLEVDLPTGQDPPLTPVGALIRLLDAPDLQVVVGQDDEPHCKRQKEGKLTPGSPLFAPSGLGGIKSPSPPLTGDVAVAGAASAKEETSVQSSQLLWCCAV